MPKTVIAKTFGKMKKQVKAAVQTAKDIQDEIGKKVTGIDRKKIMQNFSTEEEDIEEKKVPLVKKPAKESAEKKSSWKSKRKDKKAKK